MPIVAFILAILAGASFLVAAFWAPPAPPPEAPARRYPNLVALGLLFLTGALVAQFTLGGTLVTLR